MTSLLNKEDDNNKVIQALEKEKLFGAAVDIDTTALAPWTA